MSEDIDSILDLPHKIAHVLDPASRRTDSWRRFSAELAFGRHKGPPASDVRRAAVIALLYRENDRWFLPLTLRQMNLADHPGQVSFPGGMCEADESSETAASRELEEELGIAAADVELLGQLTPVYLYNSNFDVVPWLATTRLRNVCFDPNIDEVAEVVSIPLTELFNEERYGRHTIRRGKLAFSAPHIDYESLRIWGATSMILGELISLLKAV